MLMRENQELPERKSDEHVPALDGVRGLAILLILLYHFVSYGQGLPLQTVLVDRIFYVLGPYCSEMVGSLVAEHIVTDQLLSRILAAGGTKVVPRDSFIVWRMIMHERVRTVGLTRSRAHSGRGLI